MEDIGEAIWLIMKYFFQLPRWAAIRSESSDRYELVTQIAPTLFVDECGKFWLIPNPTPPLRLDTAETFVPKKMASCGLEVILAFILKNKGRETVRLPDGWCLLETEGNYYGHCRYEAEWTFHRGTPSEICQELNNSNWQSRDLSRIRARIRRIHDGKRWREVRRTASGDISVRTRKPSPTP